MSPSVTRVRTSLAIAMLLLLAVFTPVTAATAGPPDPLPSVNPVPQSMRATGMDTTVHGVVAMVTGERSDPPATRTAEDVLRRAGADRVLSLTAGEPIPSEVTLVTYVGGPGENPDSGPALRRLGTSSPDGLPGEGYVLATGPDGHRFDVVLSGADPAGTFYAAQTMRLLVHRAHGRWRVPGVVVRDRPSLSRRGMIEGFYGPVWSAADRANALRFEGEHKMDTYVYAPKDDPYHRDRWRDPYPPDQLHALGDLVHTAQDNHVDFVFAISPGQDICYSGDDDWGALRAKAQSVYDLGVRSFAIFFDDIAATRGCASDQARFGSDASPPAAAQAFLLNRFRDDFLATHPGTEPLRTVPTEYNGLSSSPYKERFAQLVEPDVHVYWTGPDVVSATISDSAIAAAHALYRHPLEIWDNYPVNDYRLDRLFLGPVTGRRPVGDGLTGLVANPMIQSAPSLLPLATTADLTWNSSAYDPARSWQDALAAVGGDARDALHTFAGNNLSSPLGGTESPDLAPGIAAFEKRFADGTPDSAAAAALAARFDRLAAASATIRHDLPGGFGDEAGPWLDKSASYGVGGAAAVRSLSAQQAGDDTTAWRQRVALDRAAAAAAARPQTVGSGVLEPFLSWAQAHSDRVTLASPTPGTVLTPGGDVTLRAAVRPGRIGVRSVRFYAGGSLVGETTAAPYQVVWHHAPRKVAQIVVKATDDSGAVVESSPVNLTIGTPDRALFVVNDANALTPGEQAVAQRLAYLGLAVTPRTASQATAGDAGGAALVVISSTMPSSQLTDKFRDVPVPLVTWKCYLYGYLGMAGSWGEEFRSRQADFATPATPLSAGLTGTVDVYRLPDSARWGTVAPTALVGATLPGSPGKALLFGYERGATMVSGVVAPARRVGMYLSDSGLLPDLVEPDTVRVFDAAIGWALNGN